MAGTVTAGLRLTSSANTGGIKTFATALRQLRTEMLGFQQVSAIFRAVSQDLAALGTKGLKGVDTVAKSANRLGSALTRVSAAGRGLDKDLGKITNNFNALGSILPASAVGLGRVGAGAARLGSPANTNGVQNFTAALRQMRIDMLGFEQVSAVLQTMGQSLVRVGTLGLKWLGAVAKSGIKLDAVMTSLSAVSQGTARDVRKLTDDFLRLSGELPLSAVQLGEVGVEAARAGIASDEAIGKIALASGKLAALGDDLTERAAAKSLITISNNFKVSTEDMAKNVDMLADSLAGLDSAGIATAKQIAEVTSRASGARAAFQITQQDLAALSTAALNSGASAEVAGTAIFGLLNRMSKGAEKFAAASNTSTAELENLINTGKGIDALRMFLVGIQKDASGLPRTSTQIGKAFELAGLGGRRMGATVANLSLNVEKLDAALGIARNSTGELERKFGIFSGSAEQKLKTLEGSIQNLAISFGLVLKPVIVGFVDVVNPLVNLLTAIPDPIKFIMLAILGLVSAITALAGVAIVATAGLAIMVTGTVFLVKAGIEAHKAWKGFTGQLRDARSAMLETAAASKVLSAARARQAALPFGSSKSKRLGARNNLREALARRRAASGRLRGAKEGEFKSPVFKVLKLEERFKGTTAAFNKLRARMMDSGPGKVIGGLVAQFGTLSATIAPLIASIGTGGFGAALKATGLAALPLLIVFAKVAAVIAAVVVITIALKDEIKDLVGGVMSLFSPFVKFFGDMAKALGLVREGSSAFDSFIAGIRLNLMPLILLFKLIEFQLRSVGAVIGVILDLVVIVLKPIGEVIGRIIDGFKVMGEALAFDLKQLFGFEGEGNVILQIVNAMGAGLMSLLSPIATFLGFIVEIVATLAGGVLFGVFEGLAMVFGELMLAAKPLGDELESLFKELGRAFDPLLDLFGLVDDGGEKFDFFSLVVTGVATSVKRALIPIRILLQFFVGLVRVVVLLARFLVGGFKFALAAILLPFKAIWEVAKLIWDFFTGAPGAAKGFGDALLKLGDRMKKFITPEVLLKMQEGASQKKGAQSSSANPSLSPGLLKSAAKSTLHPSIRFLLGFAGVDLEEPTEKKKKLQQLSTGGITRGPIVPQLHANEAVIPLNRIGEVTANIQARSSDSPQPVADGGSGPSISLTIPVSVMMGDMVMGRAMVQLSEERMRREFNSRGIRLAGIG